MKLSEKLAQQTPADADAEVIAGPRVARLSRSRTRTVSTVEERWNRQKEAVHKRLLSELAASSSSVPASELKAKVRSALDEILENEDLGISRLERQRFVNELMGDILGYGPLDELLGDETITEIMCNDFDEIWIERSGVIQKTDAAFSNMEHFRRVIEKIVVSVGRRVDESSPMVDARLPDGSRVNVILPPLAVRAPVLTIRKFPTNPLTVADLIKYGSVSTEAATFLEACVRAKINMLVSGGTGTGKTTMLNVLSAFIPKEERVVTIEEAAELQLHQPHVITLEARPPNAEGAGEVRIRDLVKNSLRMRPDRIIVGECRGPETLDMLQAMNTGHEGSMTTIHANSSREALSRLEVLVLMAGFDLPIRAIREQIASSIDVIVHLDRTPKGLRSVASISEVHGLESDVIVMQDLFRRGMQGERGTAPLEPTGLRPKITELLAERGAPLDAAIFRPDSMDLERHERNRQRPSRFRLDAVSYAPKGR